MNYTVTCIGPSGSGKTCVVHCLIQKDYLETAESTSGVVKTTHRLNDVLSPQKTAESTSGVVKTTHRLNDVLSPQITNVTEPDSNIIIYDTPGNKRFRKIVRENYVDISQLLLFCITPQQLVSLSADEIEPFLPTPVESESPIKLLFVVTKIDDAQEEEYQQPVYVKGDGIKDCVERKLEHLRQAFSKKNNLTLLSETIRFSAKNDTGTRELKECLNKYLGRSAVADEKASEQSAKQKDDTCPVKWRMTAGISLFASSGGFVSAALLGAETAVAAKIGATLFFVGCVSLAGVTVFLALILLGTAYSRYKQLSIPTACDDGASEQLLDDSGKSNRADVVLV